MQTLVFNTVTKTVKLYKEDVSSEILNAFTNVPTVKILDNHYEVMQKDEFDETSRPILRVPIANTNMLLVHS
jgi:hypothetical protein